MNKTVVTCFGMGVLGVVIIFLSYFFYSYKVGAVTMERIPMDKFTTCIKTAMEESRESGKPISSKEASDICVNMFMKDK